MDANVLKPNHVFKVVILGDKGVGKTAFLQRVLGGLYIREYKPTTDTDIYKIDFYTYYGVVRFEVFDCAASTTWLDICKEYLASGACAILMFDLTNSLSYTNLDYWYCKLQELCKTTATVVVGNKNDDKEKRKVTRKQVTFPKQKKMPYYEISVEKNYQIAKVFLRLAREMLGDAKLNFLPMPALMPPSVPPMSPRKLQKDWEEALEAELPEVGDDEF